MKSGKISLIIKNSTDGAVTGIDIKGNYTTVAVVTAMD